MHFDLGNGSRWKGTHVGDIHCNWQLSVRRHYEKRGSNKLTVPSVLRGGSILVQNVSTGHDHENDLPERELGFVLIYNL